tara:strand:- start:143184 stop:143558 length:375 start_codon:yes stop_codon:yes gene_type:complete
MKKLLLAAACTIGLTGCFSDKPKVVYVDSQTGKTLSEADIQLRPRIVSNRDYSVVCLNNVLYYRYQYFRQASLAPVMVPLEGGAAKVKPEHLLKKLETPDPFNKDVPAELPADSVYTQLVGVTC